MKSVRYLAFTVSLLALSLPARSDTRIAPGDDVQPPSTPQNLTTLVIASPGGPIDLRGLTRQSDSDIAPSPAVFLNWEASTDNIDIEGYNILRKTAKRADAELEQVGMNRSATFIDTLVVPDGDYFYVVQAFDAAGNVSNNSDEARANFNERRSSNQEAVPNPPANEETASNELGGCNTKTPGFLALVFAFLLLPLILTRFFMRA